MNTTSENRGIILMSLSIVCFTANTLAIRALAQSFQGCDGWQITFFRGLVGSALVIAFYSRGRGLRLRSLVDRPKIILRGLLGAIGVTIFYLTVIELGPARAVVINLTYPIFAAFLASRILKETLGIAKTIWILVGFLGLIIFVGPKAFEGDLSFYDGLAVLGAIVAAGVVVLIRTLHRSEHTSTIFASQAFYCIMLALPLSVPTTAQIAPLGIASLILGGLLAAGGQLAMTFAYRHLDVAKGASMQMALPILTALGAWVIFQETLTPIEIGGASLTLIATAMINRQASNSLPKTLTTEITKP